MHPPEPEGASTDLGRFGVAVAASVTAHPPERTAATAPRVAGNSGLTATPNPSTGRTRPKCRRRSWKATSRPSTSWVSTLGGTPVDKIRYDRLWAAVSLVLFGRNRLRYRRSPSTGGTFCGRTSLHPELGRWIEA